MAGELQILDEAMEQELLSLPTPLAFIDFEAFMNSDLIIPGAMTTETIPCQWSCHMLYDHCPGGEGWEGNLDHYEFLWTGDIGWSPVYAFVQSLYEATLDASTILIYTSYETRCLNICKQLVQNDIDALDSGLIIPDYVVVNCDGEKVPLTHELVADIQDMCDQIEARFYDMCPRGYDKGGVTKWIQSTNFHRSHSIKKVLPAANAEYSRTVELLLSEGLPENGYEGLGRIHDGKTCTDTYRHALNRPTRSDAEFWADGNAPFDPSVEYECLRYCKLDTLAMVIVYLAVLEATETWREAAEIDPAEFARFFDDDMFHSILTDADNQVFYKECDPWTEYPYDTEIEWLTQSEVNNLPIREMYSYICPDCRRARNDAGWR